MTKRDKKIYALLTSSNLEDIKIGCLLLGKRRLSSIREFFSQYIEHECDNVPYYLPEHVVSKKHQQSIVIYSTYVDLSDSSCNVNHTPHPDEYF